MGKTSDHKKFYNQSLSYKNLFDKQLKLIRPKNNDGSWYKPFDPYKGANFEKNVGYIEGNAWQYAFMVPHDIKGLIKQMGGRKQFVKHLDYIFDNKQYDMANEPDIAYPFLYNYSKGDEWKTQEKVHQLINEFFTNKPGGLPGNDDTGTMSAWLVYAMMGIYPVSPAIPIYTISTPIFDSVTIYLDQKYYKNPKLMIKKSGNMSGKIKSIKLNNKIQSSYFIGHQELLKSELLEITLE